MQPLLATVFRIDDSFIFEAIEEERGNVFKQKFTERRKLEAKNEKLKLSAASKAKSFECESSCSTAESLKDIIKTPVAGSSWPSLIPLAGLRTDIQIGSESEEKLIQRAREAQVQPLLILPGAEPTEAETIHQRRCALNNFTPLDIFKILIRSMVVSVKSILPVDISGEGTITDFSVGGWTNPSQLTRGILLQCCYISPHIIQGFLFRSEISHKQCPWLFAVEWSRQRWQGAGSLHLLGKRILSEWRRLQISPRAQS